jgi:hypothetical protein
LKLFTFVGKGHSSRRNDKTAVPRESSKGIAKIQDFTIVSHPSSKNNNYEVEMNLLYFNNATIQLIKE